MLNFLYISYDKTKSDVSTEEESIEENHFLNIPSFSFLVEENMAGINDFKSYRL